MEPVKKAIGFDVSSFNAREDTSKAQRMELLHPVTKQPTGTFLFVLGDESDAVRNHVRRELAVTQREIAKAKRQGRELIPTLDELDEDETKSAMVRVVGWENMLRNGEQLEFTEQHLRETLEVHKWMRPQIRAFAGELGNFVHG